MRFFMEKCQARLHWGKAGWDWLQPCFDGAAHYEKWCDFGCAVQVGPPTSASSKYHIPARHHLAMYKSGDMW